MNKNNQCQLPNHGVFISPEGYVTACCVSMHDRYGNVNHSHPAEIFKNSIATKFRQDFHQGNLPKSCDICINKDNFQLRVHKTRVINQVKTESSKIVYADITLGNVCQLNCVMCNEVFSHSWAKIKNRPESIWYVDRDKMLEILELIQDASYVEIKGGDPFNMPHFREFMDILHSTNPNVNLLCLTSGVFISDNHIDSLKKFKHASIGISLEATGQLYQYIRGGDYTLDTVFANLRKCHDHGMLMHGFYFSSTLSLYNIESWVHDHSIIDQQFHNEFGFKPNFALNMVTDPSHQSAYLAKQSVREKFYTDFVDSGLNIDTSAYRHILEDRTVEGMNISIIKNYIDYYDKIRTFKLTDIQPNVLNLIDSRYII